MLTTLGVLFANLVIISARGPHHPRGEAVVKHHVHYRPTRGVTDEKLTQDVDLLHDTAHIQEHLEEVIEEPDLSKMSDEELEFYYFQFHDTDKNSKLDGLEILQAILHTDHQGHSSDEENENSDENNAEQKIDDTSYYAELIDRVLEEDDLDNDGYLTYSEYKASRMKNTKEKEPSVKII